MVIVNTKEARDRLLDEELAELEKPVVETPPVEQTPEELKEEETWKKRYGDLRSYTSKQLDEIKKKHTEEISKLRAELKPSVDMPKNKEEFNKWANDYPDLVRVLGTFIEEKTEAVREDLKAVKQESEAIQYRLARQRAEQELLEAHPEFYTLRYEPGFKEWVESQPEKRGRIGQAIYDALYVNETDADEAIKAINIYKEDIKRSKPRKVSTDSTVAITKTNVMSPDNDGKRTFKESDIDRMSYKDYEKLEAEIDQARLEGRFVYDITGAARA